MNLLLVEDQDFIDSETIRVNDRRHRQLRDVIKAQPGKLCKAGKLNGLLGKAEVLTITDDETVLKTTFSEPPPPPLDAVLAVALPRPQTFDKVLRCGTEMGVKEFIFFMSRKVEKSYWQSPVLSDEHIRKEFLLGLEQCGDTILPTVRFFRQFKPFVEDELEQLIGDGEAFVGHPSATSGMPFRVPGRKLLFIGPEGGFTDYEIDLLLSHRVTPVTLGPRTLRTEHALPSLLSFLSEKKVSKEKLG